MKPELANTELCNGCRTCQNVCPKNAINFEKIIDGFSYPVINENLCIECEKCVSTCPIINPTESILYDSQAFMAKANDESIRLQSSSGGVFTALAGAIIEGGGVVVGAAFSHDFHKVHHIIIDDMSGLSKLRGSKYVQSDLEDAYKKVKERLINGQIVLFSGTGCQVAGLRNYLGRDYDELILVDVVCHGVPSESLWDTYLTELETKYRNQAKYISFRSKRIGWAESGLESTFGKRTYFKELKEDPYLCVFQKNLSLRESCYHCKFKSASLISDISIGDLWGADEISPEFNDNKGISFVLINSPKGKDLFDRISGLLSYKDIDVQEAIKRNRNISTSAVRPPERQQFFKDLSVMGTSLVLKKYAAPSLKKRVKLRLDKMGLLKPLLQLKKHLGGGAALTTEDKNLEYGLLICFDDLKHSKKEMSSRNV